MVTMVTTVRLMITSSGNKHYFEWEGEGGVSLGN